MFHFSREEDDKLERYVEELVLQVLFSWSRSLPWSSFIPKWYNSGESEACGCVSHCQGQEGLAAWKVESLATQNKRTQHKSSFCRGIVAIAADDSGIRLNPRKKDVFRRSKSSYLRIWSQKSSLFSPTLRPVDSRERLSINWDPPLSPGRKGCRREPLRVFYTLSLEICIFPVLCVRSLFWPRWALETSTARAWWRASAGSLPNLLARSALRENMRRHKCKKCDGGVVSIAGKSRVELINCGIIY